MIMLKDDINKRWFKDIGMRNWVETEPDKIAKGDRFRVYTSEGIPLVIKGHETYIASSDPYQIQGNWVVEVDL